MLGFLNSHHCNVASLLYQKASVNFDVGLKRTWPSNHFYDQNCYNISLSWQHQRKEDAKAPEIIIIFLVGNLVSKQAFTVLCSR
jgi:hypothetical protein